MDQAVSIERRLAAMEQVYGAGLRTVCFLSPVFPCITDFSAIFQRVRSQCELVWLENLYLRGGFRQVVPNDIREKYPRMLPLYHDIYDRGDHRYFRDPEGKAERFAVENVCPYVDNELPYGRASITSYHEEIRGSDNTGRRRRNP